MFSQHLIIAWLLVLLPYVSASRCGNEEAPAHLVATHLELQAQQHATPGNYSYLKKRQSLTVDLYMHVVETTESAGSITNAAVQDQVSVLQSTYGRYGILFNLLGTDRTVNDTLGDQTSEEAELEMKTTLRKGDYKTLNIYIVSNLGGDLLGDCSFPLGVDPSTMLPDNADDPMASDLIMDGCRIGGNTIPGSSGQYNLGYTAVHEVGHWFGLFHTFQGDMCGGPGDYIDDTKNQSVRTSGCPASKDTCPDIPGQDPYHNYMDYSDDACLNNFTPEQVVRALGIFNKYRAQNPNPSFSSTLTLSSSTGTPISTSSSVSSALTTASTTAPTTSILSSSSAGMISSSTTGSAASSSSSGIPSPTSSPFTLAVQFNTSTGLQKRQGTTLITANGFITTIASAAAQFYILNGQLFSFPSNGQISTSPGVASAAFDSTAAVGSITTTFSATGALAWTNAAFVNSAATFCVLSTGQIQSVFSGVLPANCDPVTLIPTSPAAESITAPSALSALTALPTILGGSFFAATLGVNVYVSVGVSVYYDASCGCTTSSTYTATSTVSAGLCTLTTTYYDTACGCTTSSAYVATTTVTPSCASCASPATAASTTKTVLIIPTSQATPVTVYQVATVVPSAPVAPVATVVVGVSVSNKTTAGGSTAVVYKGGAAGSAKDMIAGGLVLVASLAVLTAMIL